MCECVSVCVCVSENRKKISKCQNRDISPPETMCQIFPDIHLPPQAGVGENITGPQAIYGYILENLHPHEGVGENISGPQAIYGYILENVVNCAKNF